jgi:hypothetical protein
MQYVVLISLRAECTDRKRAAATDVGSIGYLWAAPTRIQKKLPNCRPCSLGDSQVGGEGGFGRRPESHSGALCCSTNCLITDSGALPHEMLQHDPDQTTGWQ